MFAEISLCATSNVKQVRWGGKEGGAGGGGAGCMPWMEIRRAWGSGKGWVLEGRGRERGGLSLEQSGEAGLVRKAVWPSLHGCLAASAFSFHTVIMSASAFR